MLPRFVSSEKLWIDLHVSGVDLQKLVAVLPADPDVCENDVYSHELSENLYCFSNSETFETLPWKHSTLKSHHCNDCADEESNFIIVLLCVFSFVI